MALPEKYTPTFNAKTGDDMIGNASPETLTAEFTKVAKMFDPTAIHASGNPGGIHKGNLTAESGIITEDNVNSANIVNTVVKRDTYGNFAANEITATKFIGPLQGNVTGNVIGNVTGNADTATLANAAKGDTRRQISGSLGGQSVYSLAADSQVSIFYIYIYVPQGKILKLKNVSYYLSTPGMLRLRIINGLDNISWESSNSIADVRNLDYALSSSSSSGGMSITFQIKNTSISPTNVEPQSGFWADLAIE